MDCEVMAVSIKEAARRIGVCPRTITNLIRAKELISRKIGRRRLVPVSAIQSFLRHDHQVLAQRPGVLAEA
jgi:excisionase family DNA binding protein